MMLSFQYGMLVTALFASVAQGTQPRDNPEIGEQICTYGFIMDEYCIVRLRTPNGFICFICN